MKRQTAPTKQVCHRASTRTSVCLLHCWFCWAVCIMCHQYPLFLSPPLNLPKTYTSTLKHPFVGTIRLNLIPPTKTYQQSTRDVLDCPKVERQQQDGDDKDKGKVVCEYRAQEVGQQSAQPKGYKEECGNGMANISSIRHLRCIRKSTSSTLIVRNTLWLCCVNCSLQLQTVAVVGAEHCSLWQVAKW